MFAADKNAYLSIIVFFIYEPGHSKILTCAL